MKKEIFDKELKKIVDITKEFGGSRLILFGSCTEDIGIAQDIDIAVSGIVPDKFFKYYGRILKEIDDEVDIVDLDAADDFFSKVILEEGKVLL